MNIELKIIREKQPMEIDDRFGKLNMRMIELLKKKKENDKINN